MTPREKAPQLGLLESTAKMSVDLKAEVPMDEALLEGMR